MVERDCILQCLSYVKIANQSLREVPNEIWNSCINLNYPWTKDLCNVYSELKKVQQLMQNYLDTII